MLVHLKTRLPAAKSTASLNNTPLFVVRRVQNRRLLVARASAGDATAIVAENHGHDDVAKRDSQVATAGEVPEAVEHSGELHQQPEVEKFVEASLVVASPAAGSRELLTEETEEFSEELVASTGPLTVQSVVESVRSSWWLSSPVGRGVSASAVALLVGTFALAVHRAYKKSISAKVVRQKTVDRNRLLVDELSKYLPDQRSSLSPSVMKGIMSRTKFTPVEVFRKYLWYLLRERKFDQEAVNDVLALKDALMLSDEDVAEALEERANRVYVKYGSLVMNTEGMTAAGVERKATCQALFRKLLFLTEQEALVRQGSPAAERINLGKIFGATEDDKAKLRIVSLTEVDLDKLDKMVMEKDEDDT